VSPRAIALPLHRLGNWLLTSSNNTRFPRIGLIELAAADPELWAQEEPRNCNEDRLPKRRVAWNSEGKRRECREVTDAAVLPTGYAAIARKIANRRMILSGYRLADLLQQISANAVP
jgi:hypothetical protein